MPYEFRNDRRSAYKTTARNGHAIDVIVIHHWGKDGQGWDDLTRWTANNSQMSAHYIAMEGRVEQQVDESDSAHHGGNVPINVRSIGIECRPEATDGDYDTVAELVADIWSRHGKLPLIGHKHVPSVRPGQQYVATGCPGRYDLERIKKEADAWHSKKYEQPQQGQDQSDGGKAGGEQGYPFDIPYIARIKIQGYELPRWLGKNNLAIKRPGDIIQSIERLDVGDNAFVKCADTGAWYLIKANGKFDVSDGRPKTYTVKSGDTLWAIAARELGDATRHVEIQSLNQMKDSTIFTGQVLEMPIK